MSRVLITGTSTGIGRATAVELARRGHDVVATARRPEAIADLPVALRLALDVTDQASVEAAIAAAGRLDAVVCNAGETMRGSVEGTPPAGYQRMFDVNFFGVLRVVQAVLPGFRERRSGRIALVSSVLGRTAIPLSSAYAAGKFAVEALAEALAAETSGLGIRVTTLQPGQVATDGAAKAAVWTEDHDDYAALWEQRARGLRGDVLAATDVAIAIADVLEQAEPPLRVPVGPQAELLLTP